MVNVNGSLPPPQPVAVMQPAFDPAVFKVYVPTNGSAGHVSSAGTHYQPDLHRDHAAFRRSQDYPKYKKEFYADLESLRIFCCQQSMADAGEIVYQLTEFYQHRFPPPYLRRVDLEAENGSHENAESSYFHPHDDLIDGLGKRALDHICEMIRDARIPVNEKKTAIRNLSTGLNVCAAGVVSNLIDAEAALTMSSDGIRAAVWKVKQRIAEGVIWENAYKNFSDRKNYQGNEIHIFNAGWNYVARAIGLIPKTDPHAEAYTATEYLQACHEAVIRALTPDRITRIITEEIFGMFSSRFAEHKWKPSGVCSNDIYAAFQEILRHVQEHYRLAPADLQLSAFVKIDDSGHYRMRNDDALIARSILRIMCAEGLLTKESVPVNHGQWTDSDGTTRALLTFGDTLIWCGGPIDMSAGTTDWALDTDAEQLTMRDLYAWWEAHGSRELVSPTALPPTAFSAALRQAVDGATSADIDPIPSSWLTDINDLFIVLPLMSAETAQRCLQPDLPYFKEPISGSDSSMLIDLAMGKSTVVRELARSRYKNGWELLRERRDASDDTRLDYWMTTDNGAAIDALIQMDTRSRYLDTDGASAGQVCAALRGRKSAPALNVAMATGNASATAAWCRLVLADGVVGLLEWRLTELIEAKDVHGNTALGLALARGHVRSLEAAYDLYTSPQVNSQIGYARNEILKAPLRAGVPGLLFAMQNGHAEAVHCYHAMLMAPDLFWRISNIPDLVRAAAPRTRIFGLKGTSTTGLVQAMAFGRAKCVRALHVMVVDPRILQSVLKTLPLLVTAARDGKGCLAIALEYGRTEAIREFHEMVANPSITPHIEHVLKNVVLNKAPEALGLALEKGHAGTIKALHKFLVDDAIRPFIVCVIRQLFAAPGRDRMQGLLWAVRNNHAAAIDAYGEMLADPELLPLVGHDLSRWLGGVLSNLEKLPAPAGGGKLLPALREDQSPGLSALRRMVERPEIGTHLDQKTRRKFRFDDPAEVPRVEIIDGIATLTTVHTPPSLRSIVVAVIRSFFSRRH